MKIWLVLLRLAQFRARTERERELEQRYVAAERRSVISINRADQAIAALQAEIELARDG